RGEGVGGKERGSRGGRLTLKKKPPGFTTRWHSESNCSGFSTSVMTNCATTQANVVSANVFFQAEDGIRYGHVTGVQTCALPICPGCSQSGPPGTICSACIGAPAADSTARSEERRVGKEGRSRWSPYH